MSIRSKPKVPSHIWFKISPLPGAWARSWFRKLQVETGVCALALPPVKSSSLLDSSTEPCSPRPSRRRLRRRRRIRGKGQDLLKAWYVIRNLNPPVVDTYCWLFLTWSSFVGFSETSAQSGALLSVLWTVPAVGDALSQPRLSRISLKSSLMIPLLSQKITAGIILPQQAELWGKIFSRWH